MNTIDQESLSHSNSFKLKGILRNLIFDLRHILFEVRTFGDAIKDNYGISKIRQGYQLFYLKFILGISIINYRVYLLFITNRWRQVKDFTFNNEDQQNELLEQAFKSDEIYETEFTLLKDKYKFYKFCKKGNIPTPKIYNVLALNSNEIQKTKLPKKDLFVKTIDGCRGVGASKFVYTNRGYLRENGDYYDDERLLKFIRNIKLNNGHSRKEFLLQNVLKNHTSWMPFTSGALATCRILSARTIEDSKIIVIAAALRMPTGDSIADNFSNGGVASPIDVETGKLGSGICYKPINGKFEFDTHPDTGCRIKGAKLPAWDKLRSFLLNNVHDKFRTPIVGWDVSYTTEGFMVIEGNGLWDVDIIESPSNRPLSQSRYPEMYDKWSDIFYLKNSKRNKLDF